MYCILCYLDIPEATVRDFVARSGQAAREASWPDFHFELPGFSAADRVLRIWLSGKVICCSGQDEKAAIAGVTELRKGLTLEAGTTNPEVVAWGRVEDDEAKLDIRALADYQKIARAEMLDIVRSAQMLGLASPDEAVSAAIDVWAKWESIELVRVFRIDGEQVRLESLTIDLKARERSLIELRTTLDRILQGEAKQRDLGDIIREVLAKSKVPQVATTIALGIVSSAIFELIVMPVLTKLSWHHKEEAVSVSQLAGRFEEVRVLASAGTVPLSRIAESVNRPEVDALVRLNWLRNHGVVGEVGSASDPRFRLQLGLDATVNLPVGKYPSEQIHETVCLERFRSALDLGNSS